MAKTNHNKKITFENKSKLIAAWNLFRQGLIADAENFCHEVLHALPNEVDALHLAGAIALRHGKNHEAVAYISKAINRYQKNPEFFANLGLAYHELGDLPLAVAQYRQAMKLMPSYGDACYNLHAVLITAQNLQPALEALRRVLQINPHDIEARFMLGVLCDYSGETRLAEDAFKLIPANNKLYLARLDAWDYLKSQQIKTKPIMGSAINLFEYVLKQSLDAGLVLEFGVRFGNSINIIAKLASKSAIHGFDSFQGLPDEWHYEPKGSYSTKGELPQVAENVTLHAGWFDDTLPVFLEQNKDSVRFINIDCDIYSSTKTVLTLLAPRIVVGTVIVFDEYIANEHWREDEYKAFQEAVLEYGWQYEYLCFSFFTKQVAVRITKV